MKEQQPPCDARSTDRANDDKLAGTVTSSSSNNIEELNVNVNTGVGKNAISDPKENTRTYIASLYVWGFFIVIGVVFLISFIRGFDVDGYKDMLITVSGVLSGPLGFIVGYYFKASQE